MSLQLSPSSIPETYESWDDGPDTRRLSSRISLLLLTVASALGYGLVYGIASVMWNAAVGG